MSITPTFLVKHRRTGEHVHAIVYAGPDPDSRGRCGELVMRTEEWELFAQALVIGLAPALLTMRDAAAPIDVDGTVV